MNELAELIHDLQCSDTRPCWRWKQLARHRDFYAQRAESIMRQLEPVIGSANVPIAVRVILEEMD